MQGSLRDVNLPNLIELARQMGGLVAIRVTYPDGEGHVYLEQGEVVHASLGQWQGEDALRRLFPLQEGEFALQMGIQPPERTIQKRWNTLLLETLQALDESQWEGDTSPRASEEGGEGARWGQIEALLAATDFEGVAVIGVDGLIYGAYPAERMDEEMLGTIAASIYALGARSVTQLKQGKLLRVLIQGTQGDVIIAMIDPTTLLLVLTAPKTNLGMAFAEIRTLVQQIARSLSEKPRSA